MIIKEIIDTLEKVFPLSNGEPWDNIGLLIGDYNAQIDKVQVSLDITENVIDYAIQNEVKFIISHHPMIFSHIKQINNRNLLGRKILKLIENKIAVYSMHTNLDSSPLGLNEYILNLLGVEEFKVLDENPNDEEVGIGRYFVLKNKISLREYADILKSKLELESIRIITNSLDTKIGRIAIVNGSGMEYWKRALELGIDLFITGDVKYHDGLDALERKLNIIDIGHYNSEKNFGNILKKYLEKINLDVIIYNDRDLFINY
jgi:dinuclear metal center protein, YbgI/SA1388 family